MSDAIFTPCQWDRAWIGRCRKPSENGWCSEHDGKTCVSCGERAVRDCEHTGIQFVCGFPLCATCRHGLVMPGQSTGMFALGGGHVTADVWKTQWAEYERLCDERDALVLRAAEPR